MGIYLNPGNSGFASIVKSDYVDKTGLISIINSTMETEKKFICVSRPRRFGKSFAAQMLCAYYDKTCDSHELFSGYHISEDANYEKKLNQYDVIYLDMTSFLGKTSPQKLVEFVQDRLISEIQRTYERVGINGTLEEVLAHTADHTGNKFIMIIDEWDAPLRETPEIAEDYLEFLRSLFKNSGTASEIFAAVYMTGILPIKKYKNQLALPNFEESSVIKPGDFAGSLGFTEKEVKGICKEKNIDFEKMKLWYDGYTFGEKHSIFNPYSVMHAASSGKCKCYWKKTSAPNALMAYIDMDFYDLQDKMARLIAGESVIVDTDSFQNDMQTFACKDDVLTLLAHLGYLTYEQEPDSYDEDSVVGLVRIPNREIRSEYNTILRKSKHKRLIELVRKSDQLLKDTLNGKSEIVAKAIADVHDSEYASTYYSNEQRLRYVVKMAYISCVDQYAKVEELPSGHGIADVVFLPKLRSTLPAMIVELKWNKDAEGAIKQIKDRNYPKILTNYGGRIVLVGVNYDEDTKTHTCVIEEYKRTERSFRLLITNGR
ncbi:MAG: AAA family ATPase [Clostridia bacterium]|nr:AAA family ATPase [Clostridia bacterium]